MIGIRRDKSAGRAEVWRRRESNPSHRLRNAVRGRGLRERSSACQQICQHTEVVGSRSGVVVLPFRRDPLNSGRAVPAASSGHFREVDRVAAGYRWGAESVRDARSASHSRTQARCGPRAGGDLPHALPLGVGRQACTGASPFIHARGPGRHPRPLELVGTDRSKRTRAAGGLSPPNRPCPSRAPRFAEEAAA